MADAERKIGIGFVGLGQGLARVFRSYPEIRTLPYDIIAGADVTPAAVVKFVGSFNCKGYSSLEELCNDDEIEVVYISTPPEYHMKQAITALELGKHVIAEKPMALSIPDCQKMIDTADRVGKLLMVAHTHSLDAPIREMAKIAHSGAIGELKNISTWNCNEFNARPFPFETLEISHGPLLEQAPHQVDTVRKIAQRRALSVRGITYEDSLRGCVGGFTSMIEFEGGVSATVTFDARGYFDTAELVYGMSEGGAPRDLETNSQARVHLAKLLAEAGDDRAKQEEILEAQKASESYDAPKDASSGAGQNQGNGRQPFFGLTLVTCDKGALRQSPTGLYQYAGDHLEDLPLEVQLRGRAAELMHMYDAIVHDIPLVHDGHWGMATIEICLGILQSSQEHREIILEHQS